MGKIGDAPIPPGMIPARPTNLVWVQWMRTARNKWRSGGEGKYRAGLKAAIERHYRSMSDAAFKVYLDRRPPPDHAVFLRALIEALHEVFPQLSEAELLCEICEARTAEETPVLENTGRRAHAGKKRANLNQSGDELLKMQPATAEHFDENTVVWQANPSRKTNPDDLYEDRDLVIVIVTLNEGTSSSSNARLQLRISETLTGFGKDERVVRLDEGRYQLETYVARGAGYVNHIKTLLSDLKKLPGVRDAQRVY